jgi:hypothetical protein
VSVPSLLACRYLDREHVYRLFNGRNALGHDFGHIYSEKKWKETIEDPLMQFAEQVFREYRIIDV